MTNPPGSPAPKTVARILQLALAASVVMYGVVAMVLRGSEGLPALPSPVHVVLHAAAAVLGLGGLWVFRRLDPSRTAGLPPVGGGQGRAALHPVLARAVVGWALFEAVGILGLVASLTGGSGQVLVLAGLLLILLHPPRDEWFAGHPGA